MKFFNKKEAARLIRMSKICHHIDTVMSKIYHLNSVMVWWKVSYNVIKKILWKNTLKPHQQCWRRSVWKVWYNHYVRLQMNHGLFNWNQHWHIKQGLLKLGLGTIFSIFDCWWLAIWQIQSNFKLQFIGDFRVYFLLKTTKILDF